MNRHQVTHNIAVANSNMARKTDYRKSRCEQPNRASWRRSIRYVSLSVILGGLLCLIGGCTVFDLKKRIPWMDSDEITLPTRITTLWSNTILNQLGKKGVRGFGGRIMFHGRDNEKPVRVEGTLTVYAFDETVRPSTVPERKFVFTPEQFEKHYSRSKLGHSYSVWLPWDEVGGEPRRITLLARFEPVDGPMVMSENSLQILPGVEPVPYDDSASDDSDEEIMQAGHQKISTEGEKSNGSERPAAETIELPPGFMRRFGRQDELFPVKIQQERSLPTSPAAVPQPTTGPVEVVEPPQDPVADPNNPNHNGLTDSRYRAANPQQALEERQKELSSHFGRKKSQVQRASYARSKLAPPPSRQPPSGTPSLLPQSSISEVRGQVE
ncbi:hypothetical protein [Schlesneria sp. DSM 10557]|uniref:hypothetical protein n=1 Tax=Schlesneria sp. DSM 10557 TaxID=3044399 RepID=UPI00359F2EB8